MIAFTGTPDFMLLWPGATAVNRDSALTGRLTFNDSYHGGAFDKTDVSGFGLTLGGLDFTSNGIPADAQLSGRTSDNGTRLDSLFYQLTLPRSDPHCAGCSLDLVMDAVPGGFAATYNSLRHGSGVVIGRASAGPVPSPSGNTDIPEPPAWLLFGFGLALLGWGVRRRRQGLAEA